ncbi:MAG TPA: biopolymer transporter ExbD [Spirochaetota bacterium]|nr:biopolymer transporter ExbD [Spirochaetota bacterium]
MRKVRLIPRHSPKSGIDLTALIDLVFLLVVFFMVTSSMGKVSSINVTLPYAKNSGESDSSVSVLTVDSQNRVYLNDMLLDSDNLDEFFVKEAEKLKNDTLFIRGDKSADYGVIVKIMDSLSSAGINKFTFSTSTQK